MNIQNYPCWGMQHGLYRTSVVANLQHHLNRWGSRDKSVIYYYFAHWLNKANTRVLKWWNYYPSWLSGETCSANSPEAHPLEWWGSSYRCLLGSLLSFRWPQWQNSGCDRSWCLSTACGAFDVSSFVLHNLFLIFYS